MAQFSIKFKYFWRFLLNVHTRPSMSCCFKRRRKKKVRNGTLRKKNGGGEQVSFGVCTENTKSLLHPSLSQRIFLQCFLFQFRQFFSIISFKEGSHSRSKFTCRKYSYGLEWMLARGHVLPHPKTKIFIFQWRDCCALANFFFPSQYVFVGRHIRFWWAKKFHWKIMGCWTDRWITGV